MQNYMEAPQGKKNKYGPNWFKALFNLSNGLFVAAAATNIDEPYYKGTRFFTVLAGAFAGEKENIIMPLPQHLNPEDIGKKSGRYCDVDYSWAPDLFDVLPRGLPTLSAMDEDLAQKDIFPGLQDFLLADDEEGTRYKDGIPGTQPFARGYTDFRMMMDSLASLPGTKAWADLLTVAVKKDSPQEADERAVLFAFSLKPFGGLRIISHKYLPPFVAQVAAKDEIVGDKAAKRGKSVRAPQPVQEACSRA